MEMHTIEMDRAEARDRYLEYRDAVKRRHDAELAEIMAGYRALARGHQVIDLAATIRSAGTVIHRARWLGREEVTTLPALAVMRADQPWCHVQVTREGAVRYHHQGNPRSNETRNLIRLPAGTLHPDDARNSWGWQHRSMVPPVPPRLRPRGSLGRYHVLWEAEWERCAPVDPALLRHIGGDLYAVLATWDLTDLERAVLTRRFR